MTATTLDIDPVYAYINAYKYADLMEQNSRKIIKRLKSEGFVLIKVTGSHHKFKKGARTLIVPHPKRDLPIGTVKNIYRQAGWLQED